jgi:bifunctional UDP-N-acetylglucosamine pyrophosphorylase/glucosamine-1-phosphate N-acetyltransferase
MVDWVLGAVHAVAPARLVVVASPETRGAYDGVEVAVQDEVRGTGDAVAVAGQTLAGFEGDVLVVADTPLVTRNVLEGLIDEHRRADAAATILSFEPRFPLPYGRVVRNGDGAVQAVVEERDATPEQREISELNSSIYVFRAAELWPVLERLDANNAQAELYLTDAIEHLVDAGKRVAVYRSPDPDAPIGVNTRADLAAAAAILRARVNEAHMLAGVTIVDPGSTWIDASVEIEAETTIHPFTVLRGTTRIGRDAQIGPHVVAVDAMVGEGATIGPFCYLRPGTVLEPRAKAGTFVEIKNAHVGAGAKVPHLSYIGDADIGEGANVAAGNITANYPHEPGRPKGRTTIGRNVRTGIHNGFEAPVTIGDNAWIAGGSYITDDVPPESLAGFPPRQITKEGYVRGKRDD